MLTRSHPSHRHTGSLLSTWLRHCCLLGDAQGSDVLCGCSLHFHSHYWLWQGSLCCCFFLEMPLTLLSFYFWCSKLLVKLHCCSNWTGIVNEIVCKLEILFPIESSHVRTYCSSFIENSIMTIEEPALFIICNYGPFSYSLGKCND